MATGCLSKDERPGLAVRPARGDVRPQEVEIALRYVHSQKVDTQKTGSPKKRLKTDPWQRLAHILLAANEFVFVD